MKNRYLYKAKRTDTGEWVEGFLMDENYINVPFNDNDACGRFDDPVEVDPNTICQCTGYTGIWENDIIQYDGELFWIEYDEEEKAWSAVWKDDYVELGELLMDEITVIGNTFDDPELMGV